MVSIFEILSHVEEIVINDRDVLKFVICVGVAIVVTCPGGHKPSYVTACTSTLYLSQITYGLPWHFRYPRVGKN
jgi:hypothetical protein